MNHWRLYKIGTALLFIASAILLAALLFPASAEAILAYAFIVAGVSASCYSIAYNWQRSANIKEWKKLITALEALDERTARWKPEEIKEAVVEIRTQLTEQVTEAEAQRWTLPTRPRTRERHERIATEYYAWEGDRKSFCAAQNISDRTLSNAISTAKKRNFA